MRRKNQIVLISVGITFFFFIVQVIAPYTIPPGTVRDLDGGANRIDYGELWKTLPAFPRAVYYVGDFNCHQKAERTYYLHGNQMPLCARDVGLLAGLPLGFLVGLWMTPKESSMDTVLSALPKKLADKLNTKLKRLGFSVGVTMMCFVPLAADGFIQLLTGYESTNIRRLVTGLPFGWIMAVALVGLLMSASYMPPLPYYPHPAASGPESEAEGEDESVPKSPG